MSFIETLAQSLTLVPAGKHYVSRCPFHFERTPSCSIDPQTETFYCFGCHASGNRADLLRRLSENAAHS